MSDRPVCSVASWCGVQALAAFCACVADLLGNYTVSHILSNAGLFRKAELYYASYPPWTMAYIAGFAVSHLYARSQREVFALTTELRRVLAGQQKAIATSPNLASAVVPTPSMPMPEPGTVRMQIQQ